MNTYDIIKSLNKGKHLVLDYISENNEKDICDNNENYDNDDHLNINMLSTNKNDPKSYANFKKSNISSQNDQTTPHFFKINFLKNQGSGNNELKIKENSKENVSIKDNEVKIETNKVLSIKMNNTNKGYFSKAKKMDDNKMSKTNIIYKKVPNKFGNIPFGFVKPMVSNTDLNNRNSSENDITNKSESIISINSKPYQIRINEDNDKTDHNIDANKHNEDNDNNDDNNDAHKNYSLNLQLNKINNHNNDFSLSFQNVCNNSIDKDKMSNVFSFKNVYTNPNQTSGRNRRLQGTCQSRSPSCR